MTLKEAGIGSTVTVVKVGGEGALKRRIMDMGITKGVQIYVRKVAPLGDPVEVTVRGYELSLRKADADLIEEAADIKAYNEALMEDDATRYLMDDVMRMAMEAE